MVGFFGDLSDLVSSVTTVVTAVSKEVVSDVKVAVKELHKEPPQKVQQAPPLQKNDDTIPSSLDLCFVTDQLLVMPQPTVDAWTAKCYFDAHDHHEDTYIPFTPTVIPHRNDVVVLAEYLQDQPYTVFNVSDNQPEDVIIRALGGQIVSPPWRSPSAPRSETPSLSALLEIVYSLHAHLCLDASHKAVVYCENGKTKSALVVACYLMFTRQVRTVEEGFLVFLQQTEGLTRDQALPLWEACPPSLHTFGRNFDQTIRLGDYHNPKPLLLRAIALQGVPVEDKPCLDIWDGQQRHVYSSHPELWTDLVDHEEWEQEASLPIAQPPPVQGLLEMTIHTALVEEARQQPLPDCHSDDWIHFAAPPPQPEVTSQWADEEGFYRVNVVLEGDFCLLCRFGGVHAGSDKDNSKLLFRYANTTCTMGAMPYELPPSQVDLMRRYASCFDPDDFLCTLLLDAHWNAPEVYWQERLNRPCQQLPPVLEWDDVRALQRGWHLLQQHSVLQPTAEQIQQLMELPSHVSRDMAKLCLQQCNLNVEAATRKLALIQEDPQSNSTARLWHVLQAPPPLPELPPPLPEDDGEDEDSLEPEAQNILDILDSVDFGDEFKDAPPLYDYGYDFSSLRRDKTKDSKKKKKKKLSKSTQPTGDTQPLPYTSPHMQMPRQGEIMDAFGEYYKDIHNRKNSSQDYYDHSKPLIMGEAMPQIPLHVPQPPQYIPIDDPNNTAALELLLKMNDPGITLHDLTQLLEESRYWNKPQPVPEEEKKTEEGVLEAMGTGAAGEKAEKSDPTGPAPPLKDHPEYSQYFKQLKAGTLIEEVKEAMKKDGKDSTIAELDPNLSLSSQRPSMADQEAVVTAPNAVENAQKALQEALLRTKSGPKTEVVIPKRGEQKEEEEKEENPQAKLMAALNKNKPSADKDEGSPLRTDPEYAKYFKMLKMGMSKEQIQHAMKRDEKDPTIIELDPERSLKAQRPPPGEESKKGGDDTGPALKDDPNYAKYFKMLKMGMVKQQVIHAMTRDEKDPTILDLDPERSLKSQQPKADGGGDDGPPLQEDEEYKKYFKMLKMGMAKEQVAHALQRDGKDAKVLDLDPNKSLKSQQPSEGGADTGPPLKDDEQYKKYFKMLKMGMAKAQVVHALQRDGKDPTVLDMDPEKSLASQQAKKADDRPPLKDDPEYAKYFKMLNMGLPKDAVKNALTRDGKDPSIMDLDPEKSVKSQLGGADDGKDDGPPLKEDPEYVKYFKMLNMGLPKDAVKNALARDGKDPSIMDLDPEKSVKSQLGGGDAPKDEGPPLKEDPEYVKYFKMLNMGLPKDAVKNALARDGKDPSVMDLHPDKSLKFQMGGSSEEEKDTGIPLKDDPEYSKYFKMMNMGLPKDAVKNALSRDGKDAAVMDLDPNKSVAFQMKKKSGGTARRTPMKKKKKVRRKKIYWNPIQADRIKEDSIWNLVKGSVQMDNLNYDVKEFEDLFTESADPADRKKNKRKKTDASKQKKSVQVIDGKRSMNGGIILARMKVEYTKIASSVNDMQHRKFDATQMKALKEFLPTIDERQGLKMYMKNGEKDPAVKDQLYKDLSECEKYMYTMIDVPKGSEKFDCMLFRSQFKVRFEDLLDAIKTIETACDETRNSERLRKMMATILTLVNQINTGGEGQVAAGFGLDALLKLNEAKAFDKKTSVLMYLAKLVKKNDESLLGFQADLATARHAENIVLDTLASDIKSIEAELKEVHKTAAEEAARMEAAGELRPFSLSDLKELKTTVYSLGGVQHFNKVDHQSGRTPMERFALNSHDALKQATSKIEHLKTKYQSLLLYFGEDDKMPSNEFFGLMRRFIEEFQKACDMVDKMEAQRIKEEKRNAKRAEKEKRKAVGASLPTKSAMADLAKKAVAKKGALGKEGGKGAPNSGLGGIAALAAVAASGKKDAQSAAPGGISALAAMAAAKKKASASPAPSGGIAAMAALAAKKKNGTPSPPPSGGIAAMAAMAASKKRDTGPAPAGGIAAMAAMAASRKKEVKPSNSGGLAAMAAMASKKKGDKPAPGGLAAMAAMSSKKREASPPPSGGLAAMAAMASKKKGVAPPSSGGLAAMAAMASKKREASPPPPGGLTAMAAMASKKKGVGPSSSGGLAAMAALASKKEEAGPPASGGIAGMAAMAAQKKSDAISGVIAGIADMSAQKKGTPSGPPPDPKLARAMKKLSGAGNPEADSIVAEAEQAAAGGIAGMAAMAAQKKESTTSAPQSASGDAESVDVNAESATESVAELHEKDPSGDGASTSTDAKPKRSSTGRLDASESMYDTNEKTENAAPGPSSAGGLAAMAAASKSGESSAESSTKATMAARSASGGLAAMAAASKRKNDAAPGGLAAMAISGSFKAKPAERSASSGGLAAMAPASKGKKTGPEGGLEALSASFSGKMSGRSASGGLAGMAAAARAKKSAGPTSPATPTRGVSASLSDSAAKKRKAYGEKTGLYNDRSSSFAATPNDTLFQLGQSPKIRSTPTRSRSGDGLARVPHRKKSPIRGMLSRSLSGVSNAANARLDEANDDTPETPRRGKKPIAPTRKDSFKRLQDQSTGSSSTATSPTRPGLSRTDGAGKATSLGTSSSDGPAIPQTSSLDPHGSIQQAAPIEGGGEDDFMASLGFGPKEDEKPRVGPSVSFTMRRASRKKDKDPFEGL